MNLTDLNLQIQHWEEKARRLAKWESRLEDLRRLRNEKSNQIIKLQVELESEQEDVEKLLHFSWSSLFHTMLRNKEDQLELERQQALAAALRLQEARSMLKGIEEEIDSIQRNMSDVQNAKQELEQALRWKEEWLIESGSQAGDRLLELDNAISEHSLLLKEIGEAIHAGQLVMNALSEAQTKLESAKNWGTWDMLGGGTISTYVKHSRIDEAREFIQQANILAHRFERELKDVNKSSNVTIETGGFLTFADYFFDGLLVDWVVQGKINNSLQQVQSQLAKVNKLLNQLRLEESEKNRNKARLISERESILQGT